MATPSWIRVKEVVDAALDLDADAREFSVRRMCGDDEALETEVRSLLLAISRSGSFIESTAFESLTWRALQPGEAFGAYEVRELLGAGGMGDVYRARDIRLNRDVALKVPSGSLALDIDRLARVTHEAHVLAALNHPHIAAIYELEEADGVHALVLELVDGPTLADVIAQRAIPVTEALRIGRQIAEGIRAAHQQGIVHRDLKPSNIKLRADGTVKILDFGLAKALDAGDGESIAATAANSANFGVTSAVFGTAAYMSPEQACGQAVDEQTDIWAFGCVLYETLTGQQAFSGDPTHDALGAVLTSELNWRLLPARTPASVHSLLQRCLEKDRARRLPDIGEALSALAESTTQNPTMPSVRRVGFGLLIGIVTLTFALSIWDSVRQTPATRAATPAVRRLFLGLPGQQPLARAASMPLGTGQLSLALSPDGTRVAYVLEHGDTRQLYLHALDLPEGQSIGGSEGALGPFFSPDGQWVGFFADNKLAKVAVSGGAPIELAEAPNPFGGTWGDDGTILFAVDEGRRLMTVPGTGGEPRRVPTRDTVGSWTRPHFLPGATAAIVSHDRNVGVLSLQSGEYTSLVENAADGRYAPTGHLIFARDGALFAARFDLEQYVLRGSPDVVLEGVRTEGQRAVAQAVFAQDGTLIYAPGGAANTASRPVWIDRRGRVAPVGLPARPYRSFRLSPDGRRLAIVIGDPNDDVWVYDLDSGSLKRLTFGGTNVQPSWTPDGTRIVFTRRQAGV